LCFIIGGQAEETVMRDPTDLANEAERIDAVLRFAREHQAPSAALGWLLTLSRRLRDARRQVGAGPAADAGPIRSCTGLPERAA
jgi:hypothetical protein